MGDLRAGERERERKSERSGGKHRGKRSSFLSFSSSPEGQSLKQDRLFHWP